MEKIERRPFGFYVCSIAYSFERFAFYSAKYMIFAFLMATMVKGGLGLSKGEAAAMQANLVAFTYLAPIIGSILSDRFIGARYLVPIGMALMGAGYLVGWQANTKGMVYIMIVLVSLGTGLFKAQNSAITGRLFNDQKALDAAFSTQYSFVNIGSFIGTTAMGIIIPIYGYHFAFLLCGIALFIDLAWFIFGIRFLGEAGKKPFKANEKPEVIEKEKEDNSPLTPLEKKRVGAIIFISAISIIFWALWYLAYLPVYDFWGKNADWSLMGHEIPVVWFDSLNALVCIVMGPVLGMLWDKLAQRPQGDMSMFKKTALGMIILGLSYGIFVLANVTRGGGKASILWIVAFGIALSMGEMVFSPLGNSFISKFSPKKLLTAMMSVWIFAVFIAAKSYGYIYAITLKFDFSMAYAVLAVIALVSGAILWAMDGRLNGLLKDEDESK